MLTCVLQGALTCVIPHAIYTDTPVDTGMLNTVICVHSTGWPFKAGGTGAPAVVGREWRGAGKAQQCGDENGEEKSWAAGLKVPP